jgi:transcriptional regulator with XRE-family HTH domain
VLPGRADALGASETGGGFEVGLAGTRLTSLTKNNRKFAGSNNKKFTDKSNKKGGFFSNKFNFLFMDEKSEFSARLKKAMTEAGYPARPAVLEREFNLRYWGHPVSVQAVTRWLKGEAFPAQDKLQLIAEWLQVEPQVLRFGMEAVHSIRERKKRWEDAVSGPEREVLETFLALSAKHKKVAQTVIEALACLDRTS